MALLTSHVLDSVNGRSAAGIRVDVVWLGGDGGRELICQTCCDQEGRFALELSAKNEGGLLELIVHSADYWQSQQTDCEASRVVPEVVVRFYASEERQHIPVVLSPHSCTIWWSQPANIL